MRRRPRHSPRRPPRRPRVARLAPAAPPAAGPADPFAAGPLALPARIGPDTARGLWVWLAMLVVFGVGGLVLGLTEGAALAALAGLFIAAQAADLDPRWTLLYWMLTWVVPAAEVLVFAATASLASSGPMAFGTRALLTSYCIAAAGVCVLLAFRPFVDPLTVRLFREDPPNHSLRLTTRLAAGGLLLALPGAVLLRDKLADFVDTSGALFTRAGLVGQLTGMVLLALAAVGFLVRRGVRGTLERLGITALSPADWLLAAVGAGALFVLNAGTEQLQHAWFPALWAADRDMGALMSKDLGAIETVLLGLTAGVGEEITLRGALQPRLGLTLTAALFAALHVQYSWFGMLVIFLFGLLLGGIRSRTSTSVAIVVHALYDILAVISN